ncbi:histidine kinase dimerization/phospho-acceptor domain-containing protein, partial [Lysobacter sp. D1-1-M9]
GADPLVRLIPEQAWDAAARDGRWCAEVDAGNDVTLEIKLLVAPGDRQRRLAVFTDVSQRSAREAEMQRRHDELQLTYERLAGAQEQLLQSEKMASIGQLAAGVAHEINNPIGYVHSNLGTLQEYVGSLFSLIEAYAAALQEHGPPEQLETLQALRERLDIDFINGDLPQLLAESREGIERVTKIVQDLK